ncbi:YciI family protein [Paracoccus sp. S-4012]|uniref:YciI family protein n=1 Tax=Paracoccus sp. S-4012 TaxID=2665648 RepID=UPI0012B020F2|nr:YciI family protein [Paracoccus sp. S-4012]MRX49651.1 YciI family protein [Paracoccus sp. S-4012]
MPLYAVICKDRDGALQTRRDTRDEHLAYLNESGVVQTAGPFIAGGEPSGSLVIIEAADLASAKAWSAGDPYLAAGVFDSVEVIEWRRTIG